MKLLHGIAALALVLLFSTVALADTLPIDPQIIPQSPPPVGLGTNSVGGLTFSFMTTTGSNCLFGTSTVSDCFFLNNSGQNWNDLTFTITPTGQFMPSTLVCSGGIFSTCTPTDGSSVHFTGGLIPTGSEFVMAISGWSPGTTFAATASVPEPGTMTLLLTGAGALLAGYKRRRALTPHT